MFFVANRNTAGGQRVNEAGSHEPEVSESTQGTIRNQNSEPVARNKFAISPSVLSTLGLVEMPGMRVVVGRRCSISWLVYLVEAVCIEDGDPVSSRDSMTAEAVRLLVSGKMPRHRPWTAVGLAAMNFESKRTT